MVILVSKMSKKQMNKKNNLDGLQKKAKDEEERLKPGELREIVLRSLALCCIVGGTIVFPNLPIVIGSIMKLVEEIKEFKVPQSKIKRVLKNLEKREIIFLEERNKEVFVHIKDKENISILKYSLKALLDFKKKKKNWLGKWFLVIFDVPEEQKNKRNYLRRFLHQLGFFPYQKSVYLFPYECRKEIALIKKIVEGGSYIKYIMAEEIEDENTVKRFFNL
jgi:CRISPR-associated endonuclease Cas2